MISLISCEWLRIKKTVVLTFLAHSLLMSVLVFFGLFNSVVIGFKMSLILFYGLCGFLFGLVQMKKYTQSSRWAYFINRPIHAKQVFLALLIATLLGLIIGLILPILLTTLALDWSQKQVIDLRHYQQLSYFLGMTLCFYLLATYITLSQKKTGALLLLIVILPIISLNMGGHVLWLLLSVFILLLLLNISIVKADLDGMPNNQILYATTALSFQYTLYFIIVSLFFMANEIKLDIEDSISEQTLSNELISSHQFKDLVRLPSQDLMIAALTDPQNTHKELIEEIKLNETSRIRKRVWFHPTKQQIQFMDENELIIEDKTNQLIWTFSHDLMLFVGKNQNNPQVIAYLGPLGMSETLDHSNLPEPFIAVPWIEQDQFISGNKIFRYLPEIQSVQLLFSVDNDEHLLNVLQHQGSIKSVITTEHLYLFDSNDYNLKRFPLAAKLKLPLSGDYNNLWDVNVIELKDRFILTFLYGKSSRHAIYTAEQLTYEFYLSGKLKPINHRLLEHSSPYIIKDLDFILSPAWKTFLDYVPTHPGQDRYLTTRPQVKSYSPQTTSTVAILAIIYAFLTWLIAKNRTISVTKKWLWVICNTLLGLPGVLSFMLLTARKPKELQALKVGNQTGAINHV